MHSFKAASPNNNDLYCHSSFFLRGDDGGRNRNQTRFSDVGDVAVAVAVVHHNDALDLTSSSMVGLRSNNPPIFHINPHYGSALNTSIGPARADTGQFLYQKGSMFGAALGTGNFESWGDSSMADHSPSQQTDTSTDPDVDVKNKLNGVQQEGTLVVDSMDRSCSQAKASDQKTLRRLAQNREAARKSRLRKKAYVEQLENSRLKLAQLEQELQQARQQGMLIGAGIPGDQSHLVAGNGALAFDMGYARWVDDHHRLINELRSGVNSQMADAELRLLVDGVMAHRDELFRLKSIGTKSDVFHMLSGMWKTPAERCFMWLGGFRSSELLKILGNHLEPLTDQQLMGICNLQQSSQQAEDALSQGMEAFQQSLVDTICIGPSGSGNVGDYMAQMATAMAKLATLENFLHQADLLRQQTLHQLHRILTTRQAARALLVISDYTSRLRALSSLWLARPRE